MQARAWQIVFHLHADMTASVRIHVDGRLLLPSCSGLPMAEALGYIEAALIDSHPTDLMQLRTQGPAGTIRTARLTGAEPAQRWLLERADELRRALDSTHPADADSSAQSGLRAALRPAEEEEARGRQRSVR